MGTEDFKNKVAEILKDNITFSGQVGSYVIHGALEKIWELHLSATMELQLPVKFMEWWISDSVNSIDRELEDLTPKELYDYWIEKYLQNMIEIILEDVKMPPINERRYQHLPVSDNLKKWIVIDSTAPQYSPNYLRYKGRFEETCMACYNLNKKYYRENIYQPDK